MDKWTLQEEAYKRGYEKALEDMMSNSTAFILSDLKLSPGDQFYDTVTTILSVFPNTTTFMLAKLRYLFSKLVRQERTMDLTDIPALRDLRDEVNDLLNAYAKRGKEWWHND